MRAKDQADRTGGARGGAPGRRGAGEVSGAPGRRGERRGGRGRSGSATNARVWGEAVADVADGSDQRLVLGAELGPQPTDVHVHGAGAAVVVVAPHVGQQVFAGETTRLAYMTDEAVEGRDSFLQKRARDWSKFPYYF